MSRRWPVYEKAQAKRAEEQKIKDAELARLLESQSRKLSKGATPDVEVPRQRNAAEVARPVAVQSGKGPAQVKVVPGKRKGANRPDVQREAQL